MGGGHEGNIKSDWVGGARETSRVTEVWSLYPFIPLPAGGPGARLFLHRPAGGVEMLT